MTAEAALALVREALLSFPSARPLKTLKDAQGEAARAARAAVSVLLPELSGMSAGERRRAVFEAVREINRAALDAAERMQKTRAKAIGEEALGTARPAFDAARARNLAEHAEALYESGGEEGLTESQARGLSDTIENNARLCVDDAERELAEARYQMGKRAMIVRTCVGANACAWCLAAAGEYEYGPQMDKGHAFGRHANCDCLIEYDPGTGKTETVRNYHLGSKNREALLRGETILETGAKKTLGWKDRHAERYYDEIRNRAPFSDATKIASHVKDITREEAEEIRQHMFIREHKRDGRIARFDASYEQAEAWQRLISGKGIRESDRIMLLHELMESRIMTETGCAYEEAHGQANAVYNWWAAHRAEEEVRRK